MNGLGTTTIGDVEIVSAFTATNQSIQAVQDAPGWNVVGAFFLSTTTEAQLEALGSVSDSSLAMTVRLFDLEENEPVSGSDALIQSTTDQRVTSGLIQLFGQRSYQMQAQVVGAEGAQYFGALKSATLV